MEPEATPRCEPLRLRTAGNRFESFCSSGGFGELLNFSGSKEECGPGDPRSKRRRFRSAARWVLADAKGPLNVIPGSHGERAQQGERRAEKQNNPRFIRRSSPQLPLDKRYAQY